jgi:tetratricopeptide (TPR) repeat protein
MCDQPGMRFDEWAEENVLAKHVRSGVIDRATVAVRDDGNFAPIVLEHSRSTLASVTNPLVVVANYFFDSIPSDAFRVRDGQLFEARTRFVRARKTDTFNGLENEEEPTETGATHYGNAALDAVLASYVRDYAEASLLMPIAGIRCIDALQELAGGRIFVLALDKGITGHGRVAGWFNQPFVPHDEVFSYLVNFDAMRRWFEVKGGSALCTTHDDRSLVAFAGVLPGATATSSHLRRYFADHIDSVDAFNAFNAFAHGVHEVPKVAKSAAVAPLLDLLAQMRGDPDAFAAVIYRTIDVIAATETGVRSLALRLAQAAKENFYSPRFHNDVYYWSGRLHYALGDLDTAERDFDASLSIFGKRSHAHFFLGVIAERRGFAETALDHYARHRTVDAECQATKNAIRRVSGKLTATRGQAPPAASR